MKKITSIMLMALMCVVSIHASVTLNGKQCTVDTILHRQIGPGVVQTIVRIPEFPLNAYVLETDLNNEYNRVETTHANNLLGKQEYLVSAYKRHAAMGKKPLAACNGSFWVVTGSGQPWTTFMMGMPLGGEVVNDTVYMNTSDVSYVWNGGGSRTGSVIIDKDKKAHVGRHKWYGCVKSNKFSANQEIQHVNKCGSAGQLTLFNHARGRNAEMYSYVADCHYVFLKFKEGEKWGIATDMKFEVAEITLNGNNQKLGDYDACLVADGNYKTEMEKLAIGDEVVVNNYWYTVDGNGTPIAVSNMVEGNAYVMLNGELTERNTNEAYNSQVYSRTAYGCNADGTKLYMLVIDKSTHPEYGTSAGCTTTVMCNLFKYLVPDVWNVANMDAGGSAQMMVCGEVVNKTTEASPRAVANGMMLFSTAPEADRDVIASLQFAKPNMKAPICYTLAPQVLGYNKYGELISENVEVTYTCSENVGVPINDGKAIEMQGKPSLGTISAHYNNIEVTAPISVMNSEFAIRIKPMILIDNKREYPIEITTTVGNEVLNYDAAAFDWEIEDESIATIENGVLKGLKEGTTKIKTVMGDYSDETMVKVEIAPSSVMSQQWNDWSVVSANLSADAVLSPDGLLTFAFSGKRRATITMEKDVMIYSLPDSLFLEVETSTPLNEIRMDVRTALISDVNEIVIGADGIAAGHYKWDLMNFMGGNSDIANYPINIKQIIYNISSKKGYVSGNNTISMKLYGVYGDEASAIEKVTNAEKTIKVMSGLGKVFVASSGIDIVNMKIYDVSGYVLYNKEIQIDGGSVVVLPSLAPGVYLVKVTDGMEYATCKVMIK